MTNLLDFVASLFCDQRLSNCPPFLIQLNQTPRIPSLQLPLDLILADPDPNFDIGSCLCNDQIYPHNDLTDHQAIFPYHIAEVLLWGQAKTNF